MLKKILGGLLLSATLLASVSARAEVSEVRIVRGYPISYLPLMVMEHDRLLEKHLKAAGLNNVKVTYKTVSGPNVTTDMLLSGTIEFAAGGVPSFINLWAKTHGGVKGAGALSQMPIFLNTRDPNVHSVKDFSGKDRISMPSVKSSIQAILLEMAAAQAFGQTHYDKLDPLTVTLGHPDALVAMQNGSGGINSDFTAPPFQYIELKTPGIHNVTSSYRILGGPASFNVAYTTTRFHDANPKTYAAFFAALNEAMAIIRHDRKHAAAVYLSFSKSKSVNEGLLMEILNDRDTQFTTTPKNVMQFASFMGKIGMIKTKPATWKEMFFPEVAHQAGS